MPLWQRAGARPPHRCERRDQTQLAATASRPQRADGEAHHRKSNEVPVCSTYSLYSTRFFRFIAALLLDQDHARRLRSLPNVFMTAWRFSARYAHVVRVDWNIVSIDSE